MVLALLVLRESNGFLRLLAERLALLVFLEVQLSGEKQQVLVLGFGNVNRFRYVLDLVQVVCVVEDVKLLEEWLYLDV